MYVADAAAIKVSHWQKLLWKKDVFILCVGSHLIPCSVPKTN